MPATSSSRKRRGSDAPIAPADRRLAGELAALFETGSSPARVSVHSEDGNVVELPPSLAGVIERVAALVASGANVAILPQEEELTSQQAADIVGVSRQYMVRLLERGDIPSSKVGKHRRVSAGDLAAYRLKREEGRRDALATMAGQAQASGGYDTPPRFGPRRD